MLNIMRLEVCICHGYDTLTCHMTHLCCLHFVCQEYASRLIQVLAPGIADTLGIFIEVIGAIQTLLVTCCSS
jgi:hypothetical protein